MGPGSGSYGTVHSDVTRNEVRFQKMTLMEEFVIFRINNNQEYKRPWKGSQSPSTHHIDWFYRSGREVPPDPSVVPHARYIDVVEVTQNADNSALVPTLRLYEVPSSMIPGFLVSTSQWSEPKGLAALASLQMGVPGPSAPYYRGLFHISLGPKILNPKIP